MGLPIPWPCISSLGARLGNVECWYYVTGHNRKSTMTKLATKTTLYVTSWRKYLLTFISLSTKEMHPFFSWKFYSSKLQMMSIRNSRNSLLFWIYAPGGTPGNSWWGCAARFSKFWPDFRPKNVIFHTRFRTRPLKFQTLPLGRNYVIINKIRVQTKKFFKGISNSHIFLSFLRNWKDKDVHTIP